MRWMIFLMQKNRKSSRSCYDRHCCRFTLPHLLEVDALSMLHLALDRREIDYAPVHLFRFIYWILRNFFHPA